MRGFQPIDQLGLRRIDLPSCAVCIEPFASVHLRKSKPPPRAPRPLGAHQVAPDLPRISFPFPRPRVDELAGLLANAAQRQVGSSGTDTRLFLELADGCYQRVLSFFHQALRNGPSTQVARLPERSARMGEEDLEPTAGKAKQEQTRAYVRTICPRHREG